MEGDLLGLDFGPVSASNQTPQVVQPFTIGSPHLQPPAGQLQSPPVQLQPPTVQSHTALLAPPVVQLAPPPAQIHPKTSNFPPTTVHQQSHALQIPPQSVQSAQVPSTPIGSQGPNITTSAFSSTVTDQNAVDVQNTSATETVWAPAPLQDVPKDPVLKEIKERFAGRWKLVRSDPYDDYLKAAGVGIFARKLAITGIPEQIIDIRGASIHIDFHSTFHNQINVFRLDESVENLVEKSRQSVFCSYKEGKLTLLMTPLGPGLNRTQEVQRFLNEHGELVLIYTCGTASCRRYFVRLVDFVAPLNIVG